MKIHRFANVLMSNLVTLTIHFAKKEEQGGEKKAENETYGFQKDVTKITILL